VRLEPVDRIDGAALGKIVNTFRESDRYAQFIENKDYFKGQNTKIIERVVPNDSGPDNKVPVAYGRRIINLVTGYMYKPGLINYTSEDQAYLKKLQAIFDANSEPIKTEQIGKQTSIQGVGYEFHYVKGDKQGSEYQAVPRFVKLPAHEVVPLYDYQVEPDLWAFVRTLTRGENDLAWVYYKNGFEEFSRKSEGGKDFNLINKGKHYYNAVPLVVFQNNEEMIGDFEPVQHLIDAYDVLISDSLNEFDRFAWAYLVLKGFDFSDNDKRNLERIRTIKLLNPDDAIEFLTKEMPTDFIKFMTDLIRGEIHRQSGMPNLEDYDGAGASGKTMSKFIYLMELFTDPKASYFQEGLKKRIELIDRVLKYTEEPGRVDVIMNRNMPDNSKEQAEILNLYAGHVSHKTLLENFADFVDDPDAEIEQLEAEKPAFDVEAFENAESEED